MERNELDLDISLLVLHTDRTGSMLEFGASERLEHVENSGLDSCIPFAG